MATLVPLSMIFPLMKGRWPGHLLCLVGMWQGEPVPQASYFPAQLLSQLPGPEGHPLAGSPGGCGAAQLPWGGVAPKPPCVVPTEVQALLAPPLSLQCIPRREEDYIQTNGFQGTSRSGPQRAKESASVTSEEDQA